MLPSLKDLSDCCLLDNVKEFKQVEDRTIAQLVLYLSEVDARKLYRDVGFSSLFSYCTAASSEGGLGYSEGSAYRRIQAARSLFSNPEIYELLKDGKLSLCAIAEISKVINAENKTELLELSQGKPKTEVQKITLKYQAPVAALKRERVVAKKVIVEKQDSLFTTSIDPENTPESTEERRFTFTVEVDEEFMELLKEAKDLVGFVPSVEVLKRTLKEFVAKRKVAPRALKAREPNKDKREESKVDEVKQGVDKQQDIEPPATKEPRANKASRYIPKAVESRVRERDQHQCSFTSSAGRRCSETCGLELDHVYPFALGGSNEAANLRLLCFAHNQLMAEQAFGREKIESYFKKHGGACLRAR